VLDKNIYIATVSEGGKTRTRITREEWPRYVAADRNFERRPARLATFLLIRFTRPVRKVNAYGGGGRPFGANDGLRKKLTLEVWTNAAITPQDFGRLARPN